MRGMCSAVQLKLSIAFIGNSNLRFIRQSLNAEIIYLFFIRSSLRTTASATSFIDFRLCRLSRAATSDRPLPR